MKGPAFDVVSVDVRHDIPAGEYHCTVNVNERGNWPVHLDERGRVVASWWGLDGIPAEILAACRQAIRKAA